MPATQQAKNTAIQQSHDWHANIATLVLMVQCNPHVRACLNSMQVRCLQHDFKIRENGKPINKDLQAVLKNAYHNFARDAIVLMSSVGFVPFYLQASQKPANVLLPFCLPLGTFDWTIEYSNTKSCNKPDVIPQGALRAQVRPRKGFIDAKHVYVVSCQTMFMPQHAGHIGPMHMLVRDYNCLQSTIAKIEESNEWNRSKHIVVTENVDLKDQTTSGLQLLDEQRRYHLTGFHNNMMHNNLLRLQNRDGYYMQSVRDGIFHHVRSEFSDSSSDAMAASSKNACCHIMPPNVQVQELQELTIPSQHEHESRFIANVYAFFNSKAATESNTASGSTAAGATAQTNEEHMSTLFIVQALQNLVAIAYSESFKIPLSTVEVKLPTSSQLETSSAGDIKAYADAEVLSGADKMSLKRKLTAN